VTSVFIGGSRRLARLNARIRERLDTIIENNFNVLIGDANGTDRAVQAYLAKHNYLNVLVYCISGKCRNNVGQWQCKSVDPPSLKKDFEYFAAKDAAMARDASYGFMIWDGKSRGTFNNVLNLLNHGKKVLVYLSPAKRFSSVADSSQLRRILQDSASPRIRQLLSQFQASAGSERELTLDLADSQEHSSS